MISDQELKVYNGKFGKLVYNPSYRHPQFKMAGSYEVVVIDFDDRDVHAVDKKGKHFWFFRDYCSRPIEELINKSNENNNK